MKTDVTLPAQQQAQPKEINIPITKEASFMVERTLVRLRQDELPYYKKDDLDKRIKCQAYLLEDYFPAYEVRLLKELVEKEDALFIPIEAYRYGLCNRTKYGKSENCLFAYFCEIQSTDTANDIQYDLQQLYNSMYVNISHIIVARRLLQDYLECCQKRYSLMQKNIHIFLNLGYKNIVSFKY